MPFDFRSNPLCFATGPADLGLLIAIRPKREPGNPNQPEDLAFWDLTHERRFGMEKVLTDALESFKIRTPEGEEISLQPLDLDRYRKQVAPHLNSPPEFKTEAALREHFLVTIFGSPTSPA